MRKGDITFEHSLDQQVHSRQYVLLFVLLPLQTLERVVQLVNARLDLFLGERLALLPLAPATVACGDSALPVPLPLHGQQQLLLVVRHHRRLQPYRHLPQVLSLLLQLVLRLQQRSYLRVFARYDGRHLLHLLLVLLLLADQVLSGQLLLHHVVRDLLFLEQFQVVELFELVQHNRVVTLHQFLQDDAQLQSVTTHRVHHLQERRVQHVHVREHLRKSRVLQVLLFDLRVQTRLNVDQVVQVQAVVLVLLDLAVHLVDKRFGPLELHVFNIFALVLLVLLDEVNHVHVLVDLPHRLVQQHAALHFEHCPRQPLQRYRLRSLRDRRLQVRHRVVKTRLLARGQVAHIVIGLLSVRSGGLGKEQGLMLRCLHFIF